LDTDPIADARTILLGAAETQPEKAPVSAAESALLASARTEEVDPNIREVLAQEQAALEASQPTYALENVFPSIRRDVNADDALQASDERQRLSEVLPTREFGGTPTLTPNGRCAADWRH